MIFASISFCDPLPPHPLRQTRATGRAVSAITLWECAMRAMRSRDPLALEPIYEKNIRLDTKILNKFKAVSRKINAWSTSRSR
jgi:hypothetical protein